MAPLVAATTLVCEEPERWAGSLNPLVIVVVALFGVLSVPLWPTYIPALIVIPLLMNWLSTYPAFRRLPLPTVLGLSAVTGAVAGVCVMAPLVLMALRDSLGYGEALACASAGAISGGVTLVLICLLYRYEERRAEPDAPCGASTVHWNRQAVTSILGLVMMRAAITNRPTRSMRTRWNKPGTRRGMRMLSNAKPVALR